MNPLCAHPRCRLDPETHEPATPRQAADGLRLCTACTHRLERHIAEMPALHAQLAHRLAAAERIRSEIRPNHSTGIALNDAVAKAREHIVAELTGWARIVADERGWSPPATARLDRIAPWLLRSGTWLAAQPYADEAARTFSDTWHEARAALQACATRTIELRLLDRRLVTCIVRAEGPADRDGMVPFCPGVLTARLRDDAKSEITCDVDPTHRWDSGSWLAFGRHWRAMVRQTVA